MCKDKSIRIKCSKQEDLFSLENAQTILEDKKTTLQATHFAIKDENSVELNLLSTNKERESIIYCLQQQMAHKPKHSHSPFKYGEEKEISSGGMGKVTIVQDHDLNRKVAMKTLLPKYKDSKKFLCRFIEEAQTIGQLEHPNIISIHDLGIRNDGEIYFTMKYIQGQTLQEIITKLEEGDTTTHQLYTWSRRAQLIQQICDAIHYAHSKGVIHRDLKPENIMIGAFGEIIVMDWGLAKIAGRYNESKPENDISEEKSNKVKPTKILSLDKTHEGTVMGTPFYMSPEQASGKNEEVTAASDIYGIGSVMYALFALTPPHKGDSLVEVLNFALEKMPSFRKLKVPLQGKIPMEIQYIIYDAMNKKAKNRHSSAQALKEDIQKYLNGTYPTRCLHTALKNCVISLGRLVDNHAPVIITSIMVFFAFLLGALYVLLQM